MLIHASCVAFGSKAILLTGPSGIGKSDLALRLIHDGAELVADDQTELVFADKGIIATAPAALRGLIELRHAGLLRLPFLEKADVALMVALAGRDEPLERLPAPDFYELGGTRLPKLTLPAFEGSTTAKIQAVLSFGLTTDL